MVCAAAVARDEVRVAALSLSGITARYRPERLEDLAASRSGAPMRASHELWWGPAQLYPLGALDSDRRPTWPVSDADRSCGDRWPGLVTGLAARCAVPVQIVLGELDQWWMGGESGLRELAATFTTAPWVEVHEQRGSAHNIALGWAALPYALRVIAFVEDALLTPHLRSGDEQGGTS
jgi:hypothetical protein